MLHAIPRAAARRLAPAATFAGARPLQGEIHFSSLPHRGRRFALALPHRIRRAGVASAPVRGFATAAADSRDDSGAESSDSDSESVEGAEDAAAAQSPASSLAFRRSEERSLVKREILRFGRNDRAQELASKQYLPREAFPRALRAFRREMLTNPGFFFDSDSALAAFVRTCAESSESTGALHLFPHFLRLLKSRFADEIEGQKQMVLTTDFRLPHEFFPEARQMRRRVVYHAGPTNSGKTYNALQRLRGATYGAYLAPLRLLAQEVYETMNLDGVYCNLLTGQDQRRVPFAQHVAATVEMANLNAMYDVAVVDEIQMIGDRDRGHAWSRVLMGVQAKELHLCGDPSAVGIVKWLCDQMGDDFEVCEYERLSRISLSEPLGGSLEAIEPGDCIIAFSRADIYALKHMIEEVTPHKCCVVYGALPPDTRTQQARLFNGENTGYDVLIASDAVGMGLNLNIRRIVLSSVRKFDGSQMNTVPAPLMKQIAGRAGRHRSRYPEGLATTLRTEDFDLLRRGYEAPPEPLTQLGLKPGVEQLEHFATAVKEEERYSLSALLDRFMELSRLDRHYRMCDVDEMAKVGNLVDDLDIPLRDKYVFTTAPCNLRSPFSMHIMRKFVEAYADNQSVEVDIDLPILTPANDIEMRHLEEKHHALELYTWLSFRFPGHFVDQGRAVELMTRSCALIEQALQSRMVLTSRMAAKIKDMGLLSPRGMRALTTSSKRLRKLLARDHGHSHGQGGEQEEGHSPRGPGRQPWRERVDSLLSAREASRRDGAKRGGGRGRGRGRGRGKRGRVEAGGGGGGKIYGPAGPPPPRPRPAPKKGKKSPWSRGEEHADHHDMHLVHHEPGHAEQEPQQRRVVDHAMAGGKDRHWSSLGGGSKRHQK